jgi:hypothetical protein
MIIMGMNAYHEVASHVLCIVNYSKRLPSSPVSRC